MKRRTFNRMTGLALVSYPFLGSQPRGQAPVSIGPLRNKLVELNDVLVAGYLQRQERITAHKWYGGVADEFGIFSAGSAAALVKVMSCAFVSEKSSYFHDPRIVESLRLAAGYLNKCQHNDGTIDLPSTNFHSPPDTAFVVEPLCISYGLLSRTTVEGINEVLKALKQFLIKAGDALVAGGIHTPNHRWVVCMALARLQVLFPNPAYGKRIDQWLYEKIDIDSDGQYHEKSTFIYSPLVDRCLITIARLVDKPELYDHVRKNLQMSLYYRHANGEVVTESSGRQDQYQRGAMEMYYYSYRFMAMLDQNAVFSTMATELEVTIPEKLLFWLGYILEDDSWLGELKDFEEMPDNYFKEFPGSNIIRIRRANADASILRANPIFFTFFNNHAALEAIRCATSFFGKGQFVASEMKRNGNEIVLTQSLTGPYYQPMEKSDLPDDGDWNKMPRALRRQSEVQMLNYTITINELDGVFEIDFDVVGTDNVPLAIELAFRNGGGLSGVTAVKDTANAYLSISGQPIVYELDGDKIQVLHGVNEHSWIQLRGALPKLNAECVYMTSYTPFKKTIIIKKV